MNDRNRVIALTAILCTWTGVATGAADSPAARSFVEQAAQASMAEVELGKLAMAKSTNSDVRSFAARMVEDHTKANAELATAARNEDIRLPVALDAKHREIVDSLTAKSGADFDTAYARQMADDHAKAVTLFQSAAASGDLGSDLGGFAMKTLPTLEEHKQMADALVAGKHSQSSASSQ